MCITHQIADSLARNEHFFEISPMISCWLDNPYTWLFKPAFYAIDRFFKGKWFFKYPVVCSNTDEGINNLPAET
jgi:hypothetical protein